MNTHKKYTFDHYTMDIFIYIKACFYPVDSTHKNVRRHLAEVTKLT